MRSACDLFCGCNSRSRCCPCPHNTVRKNDKFLVFIIFILTVSSMMIAYNIRVLFIGCVIERATNNKVPKFEPVIGNPSIDVKWIVIRTSSLEIGNDVLTMSTNHHETDQWISHDIISANKFFERNEVRARKTSRILAPATLSFLRCGRHLSTYSSCRVRHANERSGDGNAFDWIVRKCEFAIAIHLCEN